MRGGVQSDRRLGDVGAGDKVERPEDRRPVQQERNSACVSGAVVERGALEEDGGGDPLLHGGEGVRRVAMMRDPYRSRLVVLSGQRHEGSVWDEEEGVDELNQR